MQKKKAQNKLAQNSVSSFPRAHGDGREGEEKLEPEKKSQRNERSKRKPKSKPDTLAALGSIEQQIEFDHSGDEILPPLKHQSKCKARQYLGKSETVQTSVRTQSSSTAPTLQGVPIQETQQALEPSSTKISRTNFTTTRSPSTAQPDKAAKAKKENVTNIHAISYSSIIMSYSNPAKTELPTTTSTTGLKSGSQHNPSPASKPTPKPTWADIDEYDDNWVPGPYRWKDGTISTFSP